MTAAPVPGVLWLFDVVQPLHYHCRMTTMMRATNWKIAVYGNEHGVPHFHIEGPGFRCTVAIATLKVVIGRAPAAVLKQAQQWAAEHRAELAAEWQRLNG